MGSKQRCQVRSYGMGPTPSSIPYPKLSRERAAWLAFEEMNRHLQAEIAFIIIEIDLIRQQLDDIRRFLRNNA